MKILLISVYKVAIRKMEFACYRELEFTPIKSCTLTYRPSDVLGHEWHKSGVDLVRGETVDQTLEAVDEISVQPPLSDGGGQLVKC